MKPPDAYCSIDTRLRDFMRLAQRNAWPVSILSLRPGSGLITKVFRTFGKISQELKDKYESLFRTQSSTGELGIIVSNLISLCKVYRNDIAHPELIELKEDQAVD